MLELDGRLKLDREAIQAPNLTDRFEPDDLKKIGLYVWEGYDRDEQSRFKWKQRNEAGMDLAMQVKQAKTFPWPNCSNVAFPLVTIAALQFHSTAYTTLVGNNDIVKCRVIGPDPDGTKKARADRISMHMSYQCMEEDKAWEEQHDRAYIILPISGCVFFKTRFAGALGYTASELILPADMVVDYYATSIEAASRKTHITQIYRNEIRAGVLKGLYRDVLKEDWYQKPPQLESKPGSDNRTGQRAASNDQETPFVGLEQHCLLDLDDDGYAEPYIITIEKGTRNVLRIVAGFENEDHVERVRGEVVNIRRMEYFTKVPFIPSPDGGIYDLGFGVLLGPLNESVDSLINQLIDTGTWSLTAGGFLGRGAKLRGGVYSFAPLEWKRVDSTGDDLRKNIVPHQVREPNSVLFQLLVLLINYANRIPGTTDTMVGENPGQNTPAETMRTMIQQGSKINNNIFKRCWRAMKEEFKKRYVLNALYLASRKDFGENSFILREDYLGDPEAVVPAADPNMVSDAEAFQKISAVKASAASVPGYNVAEVERRFLKVLKIDNLDVIYPGPDKVPPSKHPKIVIEEMKMAGKKLDWQYKQAQFMAKLIEDHRLNSAKIEECKANAAKLIADIGTSKAGTMIAFLDAMIGALKVRNDSLHKQVELIMKGMEDGTGTEQSSNSSGDGVSGLAPPSGDEEIPQDAGQASSGAEGQMG